MLELEPDNQLDGIPAMISSLEDFIWSRGSVSHRGSPRCWHQSRSPACPEPLVPTEMGREGWTSFPQLPLAAGHSSSPFPLFKRVWDPSRPPSPNSRVPHRHRVPHSLLLSLTLGKRVPYLNKDALRNHRRAEGCSELPVPQSRTGSSGWGQLSPVCPSRRCPPGAFPALRCAGSAAASSPLLLVHSCPLLSPGSLRAPRCPAVLPKLPG